MGFYYFNPNDGKVNNINGNKDKIWLCGSKTKD